MHSPRVLLVDNNEMFARTTADYLRACAFEVSTATSLADGQRALETQWFNVAVIDVRLCDDADDRDQSGLRLARTVAVEIPKIVLTAYPSWQMVRESLAKHGSSTSAAVAFLSKEEGVLALVEQIRRVLGELFGAAPVRTEWVGTDPAAVLSMTGDLSGDELRESRVVEVEDLISYLFRGFQEVTVGRVVWEAKGSTALMATASGDQAATPYMVICGHRDAIRRAWEPLVGTAPQDEPQGAPVLGILTTHFAALQMPCPDPSFAEAPLLASVFRSASESRWRIVEQRVTDVALEAWNQGRRTLADSSTLNLRFYERFLATRGLGWDDLYLAVAQVIARGSLAGGKLQIEGDKLQFNVRGQRYSYLEPIAVCRSGLVRVPDSILTWIPAWISGSTVLVNQHDAVWLCDVAGRGWSTPLEPLILLEASIRYDWTEFDDFAPLVEFERALGEDSVAPLWEDLPAHERRSAKVIKRLRAAARNILDDSEPIYDIGVLLLGLSRIPPAAQVNRLTVGGLRRMLHVLVSAAMLATRLVNGASDSRQKSHGAGAIAIDDIHGYVTLGRKRVRLHGQSLVIFRSLLNERGETCSREALVHDVFGERYDDTDPSQVARLNTAVRRLREKIEDDPDNPLRRVSIDLRHSRMEFTEFCSLKVC